jgi:FK506-binding protein 4/5
MSATASGLTFEGRPPLDPHSPYIPDLAPTAGSINWQSLASGFVQKQLIHWSAEKTQGKVLIPPDRSKADIYFSCYYLDNEEQPHLVDSSYNNEKIFTFELGIAAVHRGLDAAVSSMRVGEKSLFLMKPQYCYGDKEITINGQSIPANSSLRYEIELLGYFHIQKVTEDGLITKRIINHGLGANRPNDGAVCTIKYRGKYTDGEDFHDQGNWVSGEEITVQIGYNPFILYGLEESLKNMYRQEHSIFFIQPGEYQYQPSAGPTAPTSNDALVSPNRSRTLQYEIILLHFSKGLETWQTDEEGKISYMNQWKTLGNASFNVGDYARAIKKYSKVIYSFQYDKYLSDELLARVNSIKLACFSNISLAKIKQNKPVDAIKMCNEALQIDKNHIKSLIRRAELYFSINDYDQAAADCAKAREIEPNHEIAKKLGQRIEKKVQQISQRERNMYKNMFAGSNHDNNNNDNNESNNNANNEGNSETNNSRIPSVPDEQIYHNLPRAD